MSFEAALAASAAAVLGCGTDEVISIHPRAETKKAALAAAQEAVLIRGEGLCVNAPRV